MQILFYNCLVGASAILKRAAIFALIVFSLLAPFSCKKKGGGPSKEYTPLSKSAGDLSAGAQWAYELESDKLSKKIDSFESISKSVPLSPLAIAALEGGAPMRGIWPSLEGFENLDTSGIQGELLETIRAFCRALADFTGAPEQEDSSAVDAFFSSKGLFSLALFFADAKDAGAIDSYVIGRPFVGEELIEVPVRWTGEKEVLYTKLYPVQEGESWKIQQIEIYKWEAKDGSVKTDRD